MDTESCLASCLDKAAANLGVNDVYEIAKLIGAELEKLIDTHGKKVVEGLIPKIVRVLEMLESFVTRNGSTEQELIRAFVMLQDGEKSTGHYKDLEHKTNLWHKPIQELQKQISQLTDENQHLVNQLVEIQSQEDNLSKKEREVMLKLKEVVDQQRDEIRAKGHEIYCKNEDVDAITKTPAINMADKIIIDVKDPNRPYFTKQEMRQILQERNELKANLFLVQEELAYYQREILNDEKCPAIFMEAIKTTIKKQRKKVKAKMLGIQEDMCSSDEEDKEALSLPCFSPDEVDAKPPESRIKSINPPPECRTTLQSIVSHEIQIWILELLCKVLSARSPITTHPPPAGKVGWSGSQTFPRQPSMSLHDQLSRAIQVWISLSR
ncbi:RILP-like protein 1 isoform X5 [Scyliorhinus canicula]|uniref:RILP-like protein 1 isoform X5 n=1 Tax=Scyliorhinus canicula TaxID=7830 RepID=UPI0018F75EF6|nr:RILP-like protein 1 isoform X5 [Scyliorhinus canicula]